MKMCQAQTKRPVVETVGDVASVLVYNMLRNLNTQLMRSMRAAFEGVTPKDLPTHLRSSDDLFFEFWAGLDCVEPRSGHSMGELLLERQADAFSNEATATLRAAVETPIRLFEVRTGPSGIRLLEEVLSGEIWPGHPRLDELNDGAVVYARLLPSGCLFQGFVAVTDPVICAALVSRLFDSYLAVLDADPAITPDSFYRDAAPALYRALYQGADDVVAMSARPANAA